MKCHMTVQTVDAQTTIRYVSELEPHMKVAQFEKSCIFIQHQKKRSGCLFCFAAAFKEAFWEKVKTEIFVHNDKNV